jgi:chromosome segregation ATPase
MELNPRIADGEMHSPEQMRQQVEQARQQAEYYEAQRRELEESTERKSLFNDSLNEIGMKLHNAVRRLDKELDSMEREQSEIAQINECLKRHLQILSAMRPQSWSTEGFNERLNEALPKLDRAINDFEEAYTHPGRYRHTEIFRYKPGVEPRRGIDWPTLRSRAAQGLFFHLPLFLLLLITWGLSTLISHI